MSTMKPKTLDPSSRGAAKRIVQLLLLCTNASLTFLKSPNFFSSSFFLSLINYTLIYSLTNYKLFCLVVSRIQPALSRAAPPLSRQALYLLTLVKQLQTLRLFSQPYKCPQSYVSQQYTYTPLKLNFSLALPPSGRKLNSLTKVSPTSIRLTALYHTCLRYSLLNTPQMRGPLKLLTSSLNNTKLRHPSSSLPLNLFFFLSLSITVSYVIYNSCFNFFLQLFKTIILPLSLLTNYY